MTYNVFVCNRRGTARGVHELEKIFEESFFFVFSSVTHLALFVAVVWHFSLMRNDVKLFKVRMEIYSCKSTVR